MCKEQKYSSKCSMMKWNPLYMSFVLKDLLLLQNFELDTEQKDSGHDSGGNSEDKENGHKDEKDS